MVMLGRTGVKHIIDERLLPGTFVCPACGSLHMARRVVSLVLRVLCILFSLGFGFIPLSPHAQSLPKLARGCDESVGFGWGCSGGRLTELGVATNSGGGVDWGREGRSGSDGVEGRMKERGGEGKEDQLEKVSAEWNAVIVVVIVVCRHGLTPTTRFAPYSSRSQITSTVLSTSTLPPPSTFHSLPSLSTSTVTLYLRHFLNTNPSLLLPTLNLLTSPNLLNDSLSSFAISSSLLNKIYSKVSSSPLTLSLFTLHVELSSSLLLPPPTIYHATLPLKHLKKIPSLLQSHLRLLSKLNLKSDPIFLNSLLNLYTPHPRSLTLYSSLPHKTGLFQLSPNLRSLNIVLKSCSNLKAALKMYKGSFDDVTFNSFICVMVRDEEYGVEGVVNLIEGFYGYETADFMLTRRVNEDVSLIKLKKIFSDLPASPSLIKSFSVLLNLSVQNPILHERVKILMNKIGLEMNLICKCSLIKSFINADLLEDAFEMVVASSPQEEDVEIIVSFVNGLKNNLDVSIYLKMLLNTIKIKDEKITDAIMNVDSRYGLKLLSLGKIHKPGIKGYTKLIGLEDVRLGSLIKIYNRVKLESSFDTYFLNKLLERLLKLGDDDFCGEVWNDNFGYRDKISYTLMLKEMIRRGESLEVVKRMYENVEEVDLVMYDEFIKVWEGGRNQLYIKFLENVLEDVKYVHPNMKRERRDKLFSKDILERKGWNSVDSGFKFFGGHSKTKEKGLRDSWDSFESGFRLF